MSLLFHLQILDEELQILVFRAQDSSIVGEQRKLSTTVWEVKNWGSTVSIQFLKGWLVFEFKHHGK